MTAAERLVRCHYVKPHTGNQCTAEAVADDPDGILLCARHLGMALALVRERGGRLGAMMAGQR